MKKLIVCAFLLMASGCVIQPGQNQHNPNSPTPTPTTEAAAAIPYSITLEGFSIAGFPGLHSAVVAGAPEKLLLLGGRRNGLHGFPGGHDAAKGPSFPKTEANDTIYALDLKNRKLLGTAQVNTLPVKVASQFKATNLEYRLVNGWLYVVGGYGPDPKTGTLSTLGYVTVVNFTALADAVINKKPLDAAFAYAHIVQYDNPARTITSGE